MGKKKELKLEIVDQIKQTFIDEAEELLSELEGLLLDLENNPDDKSNLDAVFRVMHTIKGFFRYGGRG